MKAKRTKKAPAKAETPIVPPAPAPVPPAAKKPATIPAQKLRAKLEALSARGVNGEATAAKAKLARLLSRYDWSKPATDLRDLFKGVFITTTQAEPVAPLDSGALDVASFAKWAIETRCKVPCMFKAGQLYAQTNPQCARQLASIVKTISDAFTALWTQMRTTQGVTPADRSLFLRGLFDGMLGDERAPGESLPQRSSRPVKLKEGEFPPAMPEELQHFSAFNKVVEKKIEESNGTITWIRYHYKGKMIAQAAPDLNQVKLREAFYRIQAKQCRALIKAPAIGIHPYSVAVTLGKQITLCVPLEEVSNQLTQTIAGAIPETTTKIC